MKILKNVIVRQIKAFSLENLLFFPYNTAKPHQLAVLYGFFTLQSLQDQEQKINFPWVPWVLVPVGRGVLPQIQSDALGLKAQLLLIDFWFGFDSPSNLPGQLSRIQCAGSCLPVFLPTTVTGGAKRRCVASGCPGILYTRPLYFQ